MGMRDGSTSSRLPQWLLPVVLLLVSWLGLAGLTLRADPADDVVAVVFPPWWRAERALAAAASAGAAIVRVGGISSVVVVQPAARDGWARLRRAGAWVAVNPLVPGACL
jgi:hypothetical protein